LIESPMCSRHDNQSDNEDERVRATYFYVLGLLGGISVAQASIAGIVRLHDHKGTLYIVTTEPLGQQVLAAFRQAWAEVAFEVADNVFVELVSSADWQRVWGTRRLPQDGSPS
jgi:hypothetical protein